ncbi:putative late blight resistance protein homolog R1A-10 [Salvia splendens]|uniref:putative late blight resistance protein homolog R1A-10 n=1 Tax=Salvia splendens TaxID=180675 RepID=UPI001C27D39A|nr:putative late blight resistance protein homolog R1A-10 [Salvia splendens]
MKRVKSMADAAVEFLLKNLIELVAHHSHLITETKSQVKLLEEDLIIFRGFLKDSVKRRKKNEGIQLLVNNIRDVVYEAEDTIDAFVTLSTDNNRSRNYFAKAFKSLLTLHDIGKRVKEVRVKVDKGRADFNLLSLPDEDKHEKPEVRPPRHKNVVGFEDVFTELIERLTTETNYIDVISLTGMFGLGKTTLAWKIFNDRRIVFEFPLRIWVSVSQQFSDKDIFIAILEKIIPINEELRAKDEQHLSEMVATHLNDRKFLIVMDDVWSHKDWDRIEKALPADNKMGKVLITSREEDLGKYASRPREPVRLRFFYQEESWELLRLEALGQLDCPSDLHNIGNLIAKDCNGLPLAIVVIGGILATKYSASDIGATERAWEKVSKRVGTHLMNEDPKDRMNKFISLSYDKLPYYLQACFLYLGMFPEDYEIPVSKLIRVWIAEGFIKHEKGCSLEETAQNYLEYLINRNLVMTEKMKPNGKVKTCRIHDALRDFCITKAGKEKDNFLQEIKYVDGVFDPPLSDITNCRRLAIHSNCSSFLSSKPSGPRIRSFACIPNEEYNLQDANISAIPAAFKLLRVLDAKPIIFTKIPNDMYQLLHLRFMVLSFNLQVLSAKFSKLWNLQTLVVHTTSRTLDVKVDIWRMKELRHFKTNASVTLQKPGKDSKHGAQLRTLGTISAESCTAELIDRASNLLKLGIRGRLASLFEGKIGSFNSLVKMTKLEKLELINDVYPKLASEEKLLILPQPDKFPTTLISLTLCSTHLKWSYMSTLGLLENLQVLKLKDKAFMGSTWEGVLGRFHHLEFLYIDHTDLCIWKASSQHFPRLKGLVLRKCEHLLKIPAELAEIQSFQNLDLHFCKTAASSAKLIKEEKKRNNALFNLSIFPAIHDLA